METFSYKDYEKLLHNLLLADKISLNSKKTEVIIFQKSNRKINWKWNVRLNGYKVTISSNQIFRIIFRQTPLPINTSKNQQEVLVCFRRLDITLTKLNSNISIMLYTNHTYPIVVKTGFYEQVHQRKSRKTLSSNDYVFFRLQRTIVSSL